MPKLVAVVVVAVLAFAAALLLGRRLVSGDPPAPPAPQPPAPRQNGAWSVKHELANLLPDGWTVQQVYRTEAIVDCTVRDSIGHEFTITKYMSDGRKIVKVKELGGDMRSRTLTFERNGQYSGEAPPRGRVGR